MAQQWNTLHIFGYGDVQVISKDGSKTKKANTLTKLQAVVDNVWDNKPIDYVGVKEYHAINTFDGMFSDWQAKAQDEKGYRVEYANLNSVAIQELVDEVWA
jgi:hypothetical protein